tara:strand:- start:77 stop:760 length:684 start_codon:yes stop_codon:yes gene_type:complete
MKYGMIDFLGQKGQDEWVIVDVFDYKTNGFFVDLAAQHAKIDSNTYVLEKDLNWSGICIEPNPKYKQELERERNCQLCYHVIDYKSDNIVNFRTDNEGAGGIVDDDTDNNYRTRGDQLKSATIDTKKTKTLEYVLDKYDAPSTIDYLNLDIEGAETRVLRNFPFDKYKFLAITIERPTAELEENLKRNGYVFVKKSRVKMWEGLLDFDSFYVHESIPNFSQIMEREG